MKAKTLYARLEKDFIKPGLTDEWAKYMDSIRDFLSDNFKKRSMGLVCDFASDVNQVYGAVFPSDRVMQEILNRNITDAMLFVHHAANWDIRKNPVFTQMNRELLEKFRERRISIYNLHVPLDNFGEYSTGVSLAEALGMQVQEPFAPYFGGLAGVIATTDCKTISELKKRFEKAVAHRVKLYKYGKEKIADSRVMIVAGGGNDMDIVREGINSGIGIVVSGVTARNSHSEETHKQEERLGINVLGGTHYSTETFACIKMCDYFRKLGLKSEFIPDTPVMEDM